MPANKRKPAATRKPARAPARRPARPEPGPRDLETLFLQAVSLAQNGFLFDAVQRFCDVVAKDKGDDLADDALMNAGLCFLQMRLNHDALSYFAKVIQGYPEATIAGVGGATEVGRSAAKAHYGRILAHLALGDRDSAKKDLAALAAYKDSYVLDPQGRKRSFHELGKAALAGK